MSRWLRYALAEARKAPHHQWKVGACLVRGGNIVGTGFNRYRNSPAIVGASGVSYHAEEVAIRRAGSTDGTTLFVARITKSGMLGLAKPCQRCQQLALEAGVSTVYWTTPTGWDWCRLSELVAA